MDALTSPDWQASDDLHVPIYWAVVDALGFDPEIMA